MTSPRLFRAESFGGIVQMDRPRALVFVDRAFARSLGHGGGARWDAPEPALSEARLSAPLEVHLVLTRRCGAGCRACYADASPAG